MEKAMAPHSSTLAWKIPWKEEPGRLQSMGSLRVGHDWMTSLSLFIFMHWRRKWQPTPVFLPGESQGRGILVGCRLGGRRVGHDWSNLAAAKHIYGTEIHSKGLPNNFGFALNISDELVLNTQWSVFANLQVVNLFRNLATWGIIHSMRSPNSKSMGFSYSIVF